MQKDNANFEKVSEEEDNWVSRSSRKRDARALRDIGLSIIALSESEFERIPFGDDESLREACRNARKMKPRSEELRREVLHVEALLRSRDEEEINNYREALVALSGGKVAGNATVHSLETIRNDLVAGGIAAINQLIATNTDLDRQKLRSLVSKAKKEIETNSIEKRAYKELFQYLKQNINL